MSRLSPNISDRFLVFLCGTIIAIFANLPSWASTPLFLPVVTYSSGVGSPYFVSIVDINGDGKPDLLVANNGGGAGTNGSVAVLLGNGNGTFKPAISYDSGGQQPVSIAVADINGDGRLDLAVANSLSQNVGILMGNGDGSFQPVVVYNNTNPPTNTRGRYPVSVAFADVNRDQKLDLLVANKIGRTVSVILGNGDGTFQTKRPLFDTGGPKGDPSGMVAVDIDNNGTIDLVFGIFNAQFGRGEVHTLLGAGDGTFAEPSTQSVIGGQKGVSIALGSMNRDGLLDVVAVTANCFFNVSDSCATVLSGNGAGGFFAGSPIGSGGQNATSVALGDLDGDGNLDVIVANGDGSVGVLLGHGDGTLDSAILFSTGGASPSWVAVGDLNGDGHPDVVVANQASGTVGVLLKDTGAESATTTKLATSLNPSIVGQSVTFTATVKSTAGAIPDGELVSFDDGQTQIGTGTTSGGVATFSTSSLAGKTHTIRANYSGDASFKPSTGTLQEIVNKYATTTTLTSSGNPSTQGRAVTFTSQVTSTGPAPTGHVVFKDGTTTIGSKTLSGGTATLTDSKLTVGTHSIKAEYKGDSSNAESTSPVVNQVVNP